LAHHAAGEVGNFSQSTQYWNSRGMPISTAKAKLKAKIFARTGRPDGIGRPRKQAHGFAGKAPVRPAPSSIAERDNET